VAFLMRPPDVGDAGADIVFAFGEADIRLARPLLRPLIGLGLCLIRKVQERK